MMRSLALIALSLSLVACHDSPSPADAQIGGGGTRCAPRTDGEQALIDDGYVMKRSWSDGNYYYQTWTYTGTPDADRPSKYELMVNGSKSCILASFE